ncbi:hypothetical protein SRHO_G00187380 [Serrasalmus rhombeus]
MSVSHRTSSVPFSASFWPGTTTLGCSTDSITYLFLISIMSLISPVLLLLAFSGCSSEVVPDFTETCPEFFAMPGGTLFPPTIFTGNNYKQICQKREDTHEFATLYDTENRIPVYSAYRFEGIKHCKRQKIWYIEPQLEALGPNMASESSKLKIQNQATGEDYKNSGYDRGHLAPVYHSRSQSCSHATFTLTNTAPQNSSFNQDQWRITEEAVAQTLNINQYFWDALLAQLSSGHDTAS